MTEEKPRVPIASVGAGLSDVRKKVAKDPKDKKEEEALQGARYRAETTSISELNKDLRINRRMRNAYAKNVFFYLIAFSIFAALVILLSGWRIFGFQLPQSVLAALVGSTAVSAISLVGIVVTGLFKGVSSLKRPRD